MYLNINNNKIELKIADTFSKKLIGFMFKKNINYALRFKTSSIHTFFMKEDIDIIQTDKNNKVLRIFKNFKKNKIILHKKNIYYTYELPHNSITDIKINDILIISDN